MVKSKERSDLEIDGQAERLRILIRLSGLQKKEFSQLIGKTTRIVNMWENGSIPISDRNIVNIVSAFGRSGFSCSEEWLRTGLGVPPSADGFSVEFSGKNDIFEQFNLDFSFSSIILFYKKIYPDLLSFVVRDTAYLPRLKPLNLLIGVSVPQDKFREGWEFGYLHSVSNIDAIPVDVIKHKDDLWIKPFERQGYKAQEIKLTADQRIYPVINIRPVY